SPTSAPLHGRRSHAEPSWIGKRPVLPRRRSIGAGGLPPPAAPPSTTEEGTHGALRARCHLAAGYLAATGRSPQRHPEAPDRGRRRCRRQDRVLGPSQPHLPDQQEPQGSLFPPRDRRSVGHREGNGTP